MEMSVNSKPAGNNYIFKMRTTMYEPRYKLQTLSSGLKPYRPNTAPFFEDITLVPDPNQTRTPLRPLSQEKEQLRHSLSKRTKNTRCSPLFNSFLMDKSRYRTISSFCLKKLERQQYRKDESQTLGVKIFQINEMLEQNLLKEQNQNTLLRRGKLKKGKGDSRRLKTEEPQLLSRFEIVRRTQGLGSVAVFGTKIL